MCLLPLLGHPRHAKRIEMIQEAGFEVTALSFEREYHKGRPPRCPVESLGKIEDGKYVKRVVKMFKVLPKIRAAISECTLVYAFGPDLAMASLVAGVGCRKPVVVEVGDIRGAQVKQGFIGRCMRFFNKQLTDRCKLIVVTAPRFLDVFYRQWLKTKTPGLVLENKLESEFVEEYRPRLAVPDNSLLPPGRPFVDRPLRIGYFGLLRDEWTWSVFEQLGRNYGDQVKILFRGIPYDSLSDLLERIKPYENMVYHGEYKSPQDLPSMYSSVDLIWACYDPIRPTDWNLKWARPNRFYESCCFQRPLVSRAGCQDSVDVEKYQIGMIMAEVDPKKGAEAVANIAPDQLKRWSDNMSELPLHVFSYTNESEELGQWLNQLMRKE